MAVQGCCRAVKYFTVCWNVFLWLIGSVLVGMGVWALVDNNVAEYVENLQLTDTNAKQIVSIFSIVTIVSGCLLLMLGIIGCVGAVRESVVMLITCIVFIILIFGVLLTLCVLTLVYQNTAQQMIDDKLDEAVKRFIAGASAPGYLNAMESNFKCCGSRGGSDEYTQQTNRITDTCDQVRKQYYKGNKVPGCSDRFAKTLFWVPIIVGGLSLLTLFGLMYTMCLCCTLKHADTYNY